jgi:tetratricopeptide (TPR) repeat protein
MAEPPPALHRTILTVDVEGFGDKRRTNPDQLAVREGLYGCLREAFTAAGISWDACYSEDRGDGALFLIPPDIPKQPLATRFLTEFADALRLYNKSATVPRRIRVRLALHAGEVSRDAYGVAGAALNTTFRLLAAEPLKQALATSSGVLAAIVSQWFFDEVTRHAPAGNPGTYRRARVSVKETETFAWICRPDDPYSYREDAVLPSPSHNPVPRQLPLAISVFSNRERELQALAHTLEKESAPGTTTTISVIQGTAGIGKSTLAINWAHGVADRFPDGQLYVNLRGFDPVASPLSPAEAMRGFLDTLAVSPERIPASLDAQAALYRSLLADRSVLVVLDNARDAGQVRPLLPGSPGCAVVITSRSQLTSLVAAEGAQVIPLSLPTPAEAAQLLARRLGAEKISAESIAVADIIALCARLPLALAIVAARAASNPGFSLTSLAHDLISTKGDLDAFEGTDITVGTRAAFSWSYSQLSDEAAMLFRLLGLNRGLDVTPPAAAALAAVSLGQARSLLAELTQGNLISEHSPGRFTFHDLLRAYAAERCQAEETAEQRDRAAGRLASWYLASADAADRLLAPLRRHVPVDNAEGDIVPLIFQSYEAALAWCESERENLIATVRLAAETGHHEQAWKLATALVSFFHLRKYRTDWLAASTIAVDSARQIGDKWGAAWSMLCMGGALVDLQRPYDAIGSYSQALAEWRETGDEYGQAIALSDLSDAYCNVGRLDDSLASGEDALQLWQRIADRSGGIGNRRGEAFTLSSMGRTCNALGRFRDALEYLERALRAAHDADWHSEGMTLHLLGVSLMGLGQLQQATARLNEALTHQRDIGDRYGEAETLRDLAKAQLRLQDIAGARDSLHLAISIFRNLEDPQLTATEAELSELQNENR